MSMMEQNSHFYKYPSSYQYVTSYELKINEPVFKAGDRPGNFVNWRKWMDANSPWRVSSIVLDPLTNKRCLKYIFEGYGDMIKYIKKVTSEWPTLIYKVEKIRMNL